MNVLFVYAAPLEGDAVAAQLGRTLRLGVGKTAATLTLTRALATEELPDAVLLFGVGGAYPDRHRTPAAPALRLLDRCLVSNDLLADDGVATPDGFRSLAELRLGAIGPFAADPDLTERIRKILGCPVVTGATVSTCSGDETISSTNAKRSGASIESMEGAAIAAVCQSFGVPFAQLRVVSNETGDRARGGWDLGGAVKKLQSTVLELTRL